MSERESKPSFQKLSVARKSIEAGPPGGRGLEKYAEELLVPEGDLVGDRVLDLGAGSTARFAREMKEKHPDASVISYSAGYADNEVRNKVAQNASMLIAEGTIIAGRARRLPFPDNSFNKVIALHISQYLTNDEFDQMILEIFRVLAEDGDAYVGPIARRENYSSIGVASIPGKLFGGRFDVIPADENTSFDWIDGVNPEGLPVSTLHLHKKSSNQ